MSTTALAELPTAITLDAHQRACVISDLHLWQDRPLTLARFRACVERAVRECDALIILGDLFEYWAGDDDLDAPAIAPVVSTLRAAADAGLLITFMHGNRDFLAGASFARAARLRLLADPCLVTLGAQRILITHGDALCTDDVDYQRFRTQVRDPHWQSQFLAQPLAQRHAIIADLRARSEDRKARAPQAIMDVNAQAVDALFASHGVDQIVHGHTHRPGMHRTPRGTRWVLPDWEFDDGPQRGGGVFIDAKGVQAFDA